MNKNIVICLDGTWNDKDDQSALSNVALLHEMCANDGTNQITYYDKGVGTDGWYDKKLGGVHGIGLSQNIKEAYTYLVKNYNANDSVFIFGFSRGAYTARSLAGLAYRCGLLIESNSLQAEVENLYKAYKDEDAGKMDNYKSANRKCPIDMLGVWDTVGALGIPISLLREGSEKFFSFHDTKLSPEVKFACHAVAIDEKRQSFQPTLWQETTENKSRMKQVWFPGVHSDVGGGYPERHHSDVALKWMVDQAAGRGLLIKEDSAYEYQADLSKNIHASAFKIFGKELGVEERDAPVTAENIPKVHQSVREKMKRDRYYRPLALKKYIVDLNTLAPYEVEE
jgi:uncharacterized protein (DUF2235 family)